MTIFKSESTILFISIGIYLLLIFFNVFLSGGIIQSKLHEPYLVYFSNPVISSIYSYSLFLNFIALGILLYRVIYYPSGGLYILLVIILLIILSVQIFLIWYELYFGSTFSYGEVRDKQGLPIFGLNNMGFVGSIFLFLLLFNTIFERWFHQKKLRLFLGNVILALLLISAHVILYFNLKDSWKIWSS